MPKRRKKQRFTCCQRIEHLTAFVRNLLEPYDVTFKHWAPLIASYSIGHDVVKQTSEKMPTDLPGRCIEAGTIQNCDDMFLIPNWWYDMVIVDWEWYADGLLLFRSDSDYFRIPAAPCDELNIVALLRKRGKRSLPLCSKAYGLVP